MISKIKRVNNEYLIILSITVFIFCINILHIKEIGIPTILDDEFGYWSNAAYFAGFNWSPTVSKIPYYSYGYSLILVPLFWIFHNTMNMYKAAIVLNGIMISSSFLICYRVAKKLAKDNDKYMLICISILILMYPTYIVYSRIAWSECLLMFIFWILTSCFIKINEKVNSSLLIIIGFLSGFIYMVHQRTLGILMATIIIAFIMKVSNKINIKQLLYILIPIGVVLSLHFYLKYNIQNNLWLNNVVGNVNDYSGQIVKIKKLFTIEGFLNIVKELIGQLFYIGAASYLIFYIGLYGLVKDIKSRFNYSRNFIEISKNDNFIPFLFLLISFTLTLLISIIFFINPIRINEIIFGRYIEIISGPIILIGFIQLINGELFLVKNLYIKLVVGFGILTVTTSYIIKSSGLKDSQTIDIIGLFLGNSALNIFIPAFLGIAILRLLFISFTKHNSNKIYTTLGLIICIFFIIGNSAVNSIAEQNQSRLQILKAINTIKAYDVPIYFVCNNVDDCEEVKWDDSIIRDRSVADYCQFLLYDQVIKPINVKDLKKISGNKFLIITNNIKISNIQKEYLIFSKVKDNNLIIMKSSDNDVVKEDIN